MAAGPIRAGEDRGLVRPGMKPDDPTMGDECDIGLRLIRWMSWLVSRRFVGDVAGGALEAR